MNIYRFFKGYYKVRIIGNHINRILNRALGKNLYLWELRQIRDNQMEFNVSKTGFPIIKDIADEVDCEVVIITYNGLDKLMKNLKKRWMFSYSAVVVLVSILLSSSFIWTIEVPEVDYVSKEEVVEVLEEMGIKKGSFRKDIDYRTVANALVTRLDNLIWADLELRGTRLNVSLVPRKHAPKIIERDVPTDIIAKKDGYIEEIVAENGEKKVKSGDTVIKGQVLISGLVSSTSVGTRYVHSLGSVTARTWQEMEKEQELYKYEKDFTGNSIKKREIEISFLKIPLFFQKNIDFYNYDSIIKERNILFFTYREYEYSEYILKKTPITLEEAVIIAENELKEQMNDDNAEDVVFKTEHTQLDSETVKVKVLKEAKEEIGEERAIN